MSAVSQRRVWIATQVMRLLEADRPLHPPAYTQELRILIGGRAPEARSITKAKRVSVLLGDDEEGLSQDTPSLPAVGVVSFVYP